VSVLNPHHNAYRLPSFTEAYTAATPLTRIRDIAHRGDICHELKQEIKHTIQNKLHRNAGPEDLVCSEAPHVCMLLTRWTRCGLLIPQQESC
jgi:hypothetical protein